MRPETAGAPEVTLIATGSEVAIAHDAQKQLEADGTSTRLVSVPSLDILLAQEQSYIDSLLGTDTRLVIIEAGIEMGWHQLTGGRGSFIGMSSFGASAPASDLYSHFGITAEAIIEVAKKP